MSSRWLRISWRPRRECRSHERCGLAVQRHLPVARRHRSRQQGKESSMRHGILIVGSLYWDCSPVRCAWRQNRLSRAGEQRVKVPIRYGRRSDKHGKTFTMVFARSCSEPGRLGTGIVVPALTECVRPEQLIEEAEHLWTAEGGKKANISDSWGAVCILQNPSATLPQEILNAWQARIRAAGDLYVALPTAKGEEPVLDAGTGRALYEWPTDDKTNQPLSGFDLL